MRLDPRIPYKSLFVASVALLAYSTLTAVSLVAWFARAEDVWTWKSVLALVSCLLGIITSAIVWRFPSRGALAGGMAVMALAYVRVGTGEWSMVTLVTFLVTTALLVPLVQALLLMPRD